MKAAASRFWVLALVLTLSSCFGEGSRTRRQYSSSEEDFARGGVKGANPKPSPSPSPVTTTSTTITTTTSSSTSTSTRPSTTTTSTSVPVTTTTMPSGGGASALFMDGFEYPVSTSDLDAVDRFKVLGGWSHAKTHQSSSGAHGYLYTVDSIPGYSGPFPGRESSRVLAIAALPATLGGQTDFYLQLGNGSSAAYDDTIPGDVWIQFWIYPQNYGSEASVYANRNKFFYVCNSDFPCHSHLWMIGNNPGTYLADNMQPLGSPTNQGYFWSLSQAGGMSQIVNTTGDPYTQGTIGPQDASDFVVPNRWTLVKMHFNTTRTSGNSWEVWMRPYGGEWRKVSEWIGGRTPGFTWDIPAEHVGGHRVLRMPTTVGGFDGRSSYNYWQYMDDFVISGSEAGLPQYSD